MSIVVDKNVFVVDGILVLLGLSRVHVMSDDVQGTQMQS